MEEKASFAQVYFVCGQSVRRRRSLGSNFGPICRNNIHSHRITRFHWSVKIAASHSLVSLSAFLTLIGAKFEG